MIIPSSAQHQNSVGNDSRHVNIASGKRIYIKRQFPYPMSPWTGLSIAGVSFALSAFPWV
jgi:hypothetical protein